MKKIIIAAVIVVIAILFYVNVRTNAEQVDIDTTSSNTNAPIGAYELQGGIDTNDLQPATFSVQNN